MFVLQIITICYVYKMKKKTKKLLSCTWQFMFKSEIYLTDTSLLSVFFLPFTFWLFNYGCLLQTEDTICQFGEHCE